MTYIHNLKKNDLTKKSIYSFITLFVKLICLSLPISSSSSSSSEESEITATLFRFLVNDGGGEVFGVDWADGFGEGGVVTGPGFFFIAITFTFGSWDCDVVEVVAEDGFFLT